jgi:hypothetical protein
MGRKSHHLMERVYAHLSKNGCRKSGLLADPELTITLLNANFIVSDGKKALRKIKYFIIS